MDNTLVCIENIDSISKAIEITKECKTMDKWPCDKGYTISGPTYKFPFGIWFRGQSKSGWDLIPSVFRKDNDRLYDETSLFYHFQLRSPEFRHDHHSVFDWLGLMQHYKAPTRLLDWTENLLVALYFATCEPEYDEYDGAIFVLNARLLNYFADMPTSTHKRAGIHVPESFNVVIRSLMSSCREMQQIFKSKSLSICEETDCPASELIDMLIKKYCDTPLNPLADSTDVIDRLRKPVSVFPYRSNGRLHAQSGTFTIHGGKMYPKNPGTEKADIPEPIHLHEFNKDEFNNDRFLKKFIIANKDGKRKIRKELEALGIHKGSLFPELDYQSQYMKEIWLT